MNGDFLNNLYMLGGLFVAFTTVVWLFTSANRRAAQRDADDIRRDLRRVEKRLSRENQRTNRQVRKTRKEVWWLRVEMEVVKDRLNIGTVSRLVAPAPVASHPEEASPASSDPGSVVSAPVASAPEPPSSALPAPVADIAEADVGSEAVADRPGPTGVVPPGFSATPLAAEK